MAQKLIIFDIDGTLTNSIYLDDYFFRKSLLDIFGITLTELEWRRYKSMSTGTDSGTFYNIFHDKIQTENYTYDLSRFKDYFFNLFREHFSDELNRLNEIPGARSLFTSLRLSNEYMVGIATGSWKDSGFMKLRSSGIDFIGSVYSNSDFFKKRSRIIADVITKAKYLNSKDFDGIIYFGDGLWDMEAAKELGIDFVGVDSQDDNLLRENGAEDVVQDFLNQTLIYDMISSKQLPIGEAMYA